MALKRRLRSGVAILHGTAIPTNGTSGSGAREAGPGSMYIRIGTNPRMYINRGTRASPTWEATGRILFKFGVGRNGAGALTFTGAKIGDKVVMVYNVSTPGDSTANFETTITADDAIQQSSASDLSAVNHIWLIQRP
jgi:hypothetical protein